MRRTLGTIGWMLAIAAVPATLAACSDHDAQADLPVADQHNDTSQSLTVVFPDGYPNSTHKCVTLSGVVIGVWTTTDRTVMWIYNDWACEGSSTEKDMTIINGVPRAIVNASGG